MYCRHTTIWKAPTAIWIKLDTEAVAATQTTTRATFIYIFIRVTE